MTIRTIICINMIYLNKCLQIIKNLDVNNLCTIIVLTLVFKGIRDKSQNFYRVERKLSTSNVLNLGPKPLAIFHSNSNIRSFSTTSTHLIDTDTNLDSDVDSAKDSNIDTNEDQSRKVDKGKGKATNVDPETTNDTQTKLEKDIEEYLNTNTRPKFIHRTMEHEKTRENSSCPREYRIKVDKFIDKHSVLDATDEYDNNLVNSVQAVNLKVTKDQVKSKLAEMIDTEENERKEINFIREQDLMVSRTAASPSTETGSDADSALGADIIDTPSSHSPSSDESSSAYNDTDNYASLSDPKGKRKAESAEEELSTKRLKSHRDDDDDDDNNKPSGSSGPFGGGSSLGGSGDPGPSGSHSFKTKLDLFLYGNTKDNNSLSTIDFIIEIEQEGIEMPSLFDTDF